MRFLRAEMRLPVRLSKGTWLVLKALSLQSGDPMVHLIRRAMHEHWQAALTESDPRKREDSHELVIIRLRPALAERVRLAVNRNRSALVERCCLLFLESYRRSPSQTGQGREQQDDSNPASLAPR